jgi:class 3 adenylate cyclase
MRALYRRQIAAARDRDSGWVHTGECETIGEKVGGMAVHIGARIAAALAGPSEILVSSTVKDLTAGSGIIFEDAGERELKGVPDRWRLYRFVRTAEDER